MKVKVQVTIYCNSYLNIWLNLNFKLDSTGYCYKGYCIKCNESDFYKEYDLKGDSRCCNDKIKPTRD